MKNTVFALSDSPFLAHLGLSSAVNEALLLVYQSNSGEVGFSTDINGREFLNQLLSGSITIDELGSIASFDPETSLESYFARLMANRGITIHFPSAEIYAQALALSDYKKKVALNLTYARFGKEKQLPPLPILSQLFENEKACGEALSWLLSHSSGVSFWNRFTEYGIQPTVIASYDGHFHANLKHICQKSMITFLPVTSEKDLPCW